MTTTFNDRLGQHLTAKDTFEQAEMPGFDVVPYGVGV